MARVASIFASSVALVACAGDARDDASSEASALSDAEVVEAERVLYLGAAPPSACAAEVGDARVRCLVSARYASDPVARDIALSFFAATGDVAGVGPEQEIDGGYRGRIKLVPELPIGAYRKHLTWTRDAMTSFDAFFDQLARRTSTTARYRWRGINFRFFRSVGRTTPSAFTEYRWEVFYNVSGSLVSSPAAVRDTLFHEIFHINDGAHDNWSTRVLAPLVASIAAKCNTNVACLAPYAPTSTIVRGGTYYAFQPDNGPLEVEYSAELASRYLAEQTAALAGRPQKPAFKCGPPENARAWQLLTDEFFGGADATPSCDR